MTFTTTIIRRTIFGDKRIVYGTWTTDTDNGTIQTTLRQVEHINLQHTGAATANEAPSINETLPCSGSVKIVHTSGKSGLWFAAGL